MRQRMICLTILASLGLTSTTLAVTFTWATIGNPGNADDDTGYGGVDYTYHISKHEVTNAQYTEFLNAVAASDTNGLYSLWMGSESWGGITRSGTSGNYTYSVKTPVSGQGPGGSDYTYDDKPVIFVTFFNAMRFVNWLHNGQGSGDTETGVYEISDGRSETRSTNAKYWVPSEDEWYKAAYYDPNGDEGNGAYFDYPTSTNTTPNNNLPSADTGNSANFFSLDNEYTTGNGAYPLTDVGAYSLSASPYGTFDQGGNAYEWNETVINSVLRGVRGGSWMDLSSDLRADYWGAFNYSLDDLPIGFRVAAVPEPSTMLLLALATVGLFVRRRV